MLEYCIRVLLVSVLLVPILGCDKPNPTPEVIDPVFQDIEKKHKEVESEIKAAEKQLEDNKDALAKVKPQTGQIKFAQKRLYDSQALLERLRQREAYLALRLESRRKYSREDYLKSYKKKESWPRASEVVEYAAQQALEAAPKSWNAKQRVELSKIPTKSTAPAHGESHDEHH
jgi:hypothetical protein